MTSLRCPLQTEEDKEKKISLFSLSLSLLPSPRFLSLQSLLPSSRASQTARSNTRFQQNRTKRIEKVHGSLYHDLTLANHHLRTQNNTVTECPPKLRTFEQLNTTEMCDYTQVHYKCSHLRYIVRAWCTRYQETHRRCPVNVVAM